MVNPVPRVDLVYLDTARSLAGVDKNFSLERRATDYVLFSMMQKVLVIIPFKGIFPPRGGGTLRLFHVLEQLSLQFEVHAITLQPVEEFKTLTDGYQFPPGIKFYSPAEYPPPRSWFANLPRSLGPSLQSRWIRRDWKEPASTIVLSLHHIVSSITEANQIDAVIFTVLESLALAPVVKRAAPTAVRIVNTENIRHYLADEELNSLAPATSDAQRQFLLKEPARLKKQESELWKFVDAVWAVSDFDAAILDSLNEQRVPVAVVPNGVDSKRRPFDSRTAKYLNKHVIFCGSLDYSPNPEGVVWFHEKAWPIIHARRPDLRLVIVGRGRVPESFRALRTDPSVEFVGEVNDVVPYYQEASVCIVPVKSGHGTRLKVLEAMSLGNPVVSTPLGVEGIDVTDETDAIIEEDIELFARRLVDLVEDGARFDRVRLNAREIVEKRYDWSVIGSSMNDQLVRMIEARSHESLRALT